LLGGVEGDVGRRGRKADRDSRRGNEDGGL
jgi:hypothetical protein